MNDYNYSGQRRKRKDSGHSEAKTILLCYVLPFIVVNAIIFILATSTPKCEISVGDTNDYLTVDLTVKINSLLPLKTITATLDGQEIQLEKTDSKLYRTTLSTNGVVEVDLVGFNTMATATFEHVNALDDNAPSVTKSSIEDGILTLQLDDTQTGIDYASIYAIKGEDTRVEALSIDKNTNTVTFKMDTDTLTVVFADPAGNESRPICKVNSEGVDVQSDSVGTDEEMDNLLSD